MWRGDREAGCIGLERRAAFREDESHARGQAGVKWGVRPAERPPAHALYSPAQLVSVIWGVCEGGVGGLLVGRAVKGGGNAGCVDRKDECARVRASRELEGGQRILRGIWFRGKGPSSMQHMPSLSQAGQLSLTIKKATATTMLLLLMLITTIITEAGRAQGNQPIVLNKEIKGDPMF